VVAITINHENMKAEQIIKACKKLEAETGLFTTDVLIHGAEKLVSNLIPYLKKI
jgi:uncharacterized NAD-dependent epimerase/dehydratase family protein